MNSEVDVRPLQARNETLRSFDWPTPLGRIKVLAMWQVLGPLLTRWKGYLAWSLLGMREDSPLDFYRQWKHWCRYPNYLFGDPAMWPLLRGFARTRAPLMAANSIDDRWAPPKSRNAFIAGYSNAALQILDVDPSRIALRAIGHLGSFKPDAMPLWQSALAWLDTCRTARSVVVSTGPDHSTRRESRRISIAGDVYGPA